MRSGSIPPSVPAFALAVALTAWAGLGLQCVVTYGRVGSVARTLTVVLGYFTITTALLSAIVFTAIALGIAVAATPWLVAGVALAELLVGIIYVLLLHGLVELSGGSVLANALLHFALPILVPLFWIFCVPRGHLRWRDALVWAAYPLAYLAVAIARGTASAKYPYPFLDVGALGAGRVALNTIGIATGFLVAAFPLIWLDRTLGRRPH